MCNVCCRTEFTAMNDRSHSLLLLRWRTNDRLSLLIISFRFITLCHNKQLLSSSSSFIQAWDWHCRSANTVAECLSKIRRYLRLIKTAVTGCWAEALTSVSCLAICWKTCGSSYHVHFRNMRPGVVKWAALVSLVAIAVVVCASVYGRF